MLEKLRADRRAAIVVLPFLMACSSGSAASSTTSTASAQSSGHGPEACANAILCDDFESYTVGAAPGGKWTTNPSAGDVVAIDTGRAKSGSKAVKVSAAAATGYRSAMITLADPSLLPIAGGVIYGRMMFFLESAPQTSVHWTFIDGSGPVPGQSYHSVYRYGGQLPIMKDGGFAGSQLMANYDTPDSYDTPPVGPSSDCWRHSSMKAVPTGAWTCAEWSFDTQNNAMHFWLDGAELTDLAVSGTGQGCVNQPANFTWAAPTFERIDLGWESYQADDARVIWIDDVAIGAQRIGCP